MEAAFKRVGTHTTASDVLNEEEPRGVKAPVSQGSVQRHAVSEHDGNSIGGGIASHGGNEFEVFRRRVGVPEALRTGEPDSNDQMFFLAANVYDIVMPLPVGLDTGWSERVCYQKTPKCVWYGQTDARKDRDVRKDSALDLPLRRVAESRLSGLIKDHKHVTEKPQIIPFSYIYCAWIVSI
ncbi:hypothetical protein B0H10DRAFT_1947141 [Mycena sp. CBHHK59/15]|nr:hypothetical protein B0H10DRAFT_1947141 [Mycena sp. CBHHK59/15]